MKMKEKQLICIGICLGLERTNSFPPADSKIGNRRPKEGRGGEGEREGRAGGREHKRRGLKRIKK